MKLAKLLLPLTLLFLTRPINLKILVFESVYELRADEPPVLRRILNLSPRHKEWIRISSEKELSVTRGQKKAISVKYIDTEWSITMVNRFVQMTSQSTRAGLFESLSAFEARPVAAAGDCV